jgi:DNA-binding NarL/FixJ family response regulator
MQTPPGPLRILIADDHPLIRLALRHDLERGGLEVCAEARTGAEAVETALRVRPDLCLLDIQMPGGGGLAAAEAIRRSLPMAKVVLITAAPDENGVLAAARAGAHGYLAKDVNPRRLPEIICAIADGETAYPRRLLWPLLRALRRATLALRHLNAQSSPIPLPAIGGRVSLDIQKPEAGKGGAEMIRRVIASIVMPSFAVADPCSCALKS